MEQRKYRVYYSIRSYRVAEVMAESMSDAVRVISEAIGPAGAGKSLGDFLGWDTSSLQVDEAACSVLHPAVWKPVNRSEETVRDLERIGNPP